MRVIIAEKPSVAKDIAMGLSDDVKRCDGYYLSEDNAVTYAFGHLFKIRSNLFIKSNLNDLPYFPSKFFYEEETTAKKQISVIKKLLHSASSVIVATDAGREGELIARLILIECGFVDWINTYRFWSSEALSKEVILKTLANLKPISEYNGLYYSALARQHSDYLVGLNFSKIMSIMAKGNWSMGRVQTPVLKIIADRDREREIFKPEEYYSLTSLFDYNMHRFKGNLLTDKILTKNEASDIKAKVDGKKAMITDVKELQQKDPPPLLHNLSSLQQEANKEFGYTAAQTLSLAQSLYEEYKVLSYPRTDSNYLGDDSPNLVKDILTELGWSELVVNISDNKVFNNSKLDDHHALLPLALPKENIKEDCLNIFNLVKRRFQACFSEKYIYLKQNVKIYCSGYYFNTEGVIEKQLGWKKLYKQNVKQALPQLRSGETAIIVQTEFQQNFTKPKNAFNDASILEAMEKLTLGTPATRASILEILLKRDYVIRNKRQLISTNKGKQLIDNIQDSLISNPEMTKSWELKLDAINEQQNYNDFLTEIKSFVSKEALQFKELDITPQSSSKQIAFAKKLAGEKGLEIKGDINNANFIKQFIDTALKLDNAALGVCQCGGKLEKHNKVVKCTSCSTMVWFNMYGKTFNQNQLLKLFHGQVVKTKGLVANKTKKKYSAALQLDFQKNKVVIKDIL